MDRDVLHLGPGQVAASPAQHDATDRQTAFPTPMHSGSSLGRLGWTVVGLILAWNVAAGSLLQFSMVSPEVSAANVIFLLGAGLSLTAHELARSAIARALERRIGS